MKRLFLIRHAKAEESAPQKTDFDRELSEVGQCDALLMAKALINISAIPDYIITSPAKRAITTARVFAEHLQYPEMSIHENEKIFEATLEDLMEVIEELNNDYSDVALFGHNPALTELANYLTNDYSFALPPCGMCGIECDAEHWSEISSAERKQLLLDIPDNYR